MRIQRVVRSVTTLALALAVSSALAQQGSSGVVPGPYELTAELSGFKRVSRRDVKRTPRANARHAVATATRSAVAEA